MGAHRLIFPTASAHRCAVFSFSLVRVCHRPCSSLCDSPLPSSPTSIGLFIERHRQVFFFIKNGVFCKYIMVSSALAFNIHLSHPFDSSGLCPFPERKGKGRLNHRHPRDGGGKAGEQEPCLAFTCPSACRLMLSH